MCLRFGIRKACNHFGPSNLLRFQENPFLKYLVTSTECLCPKWRGHCHVRESASGGSRVHDPLTRSATFVIQRNIISGMPFDVVTHCDVTN